jgi:DHA1 family tetracycline resistance protein-like MFS transporter
MRRNFSLLLFLSATGFVTSFGSYIVAANLPAYSRETGAGLIAIGILIALYDVAEIMIKPLGGLLSRRWGQWSILRAGLVLFALASGIYLILPPQWLILIRLLQGAGAAFFSVMSLTLLIRHFRDQKGMALGIYGAVKNSGYVLAPTIGGILVYLSDFQSVFILCLAVGLLVIVLSYLVRPRSDADGELPDGRQRKKNPALNDLLNSLKSRQTLPIYLVMFFNMIFMAAFFGFMPVLLAAKGLDLLQAGIVLGCNAVVYLTVQPLAGRLSDTFRRKKLIAFGLSTATVSIMLITFFGAPYYLIFSFMLAIGIGCVAPLGEAFVGDVSHPDDLAINLGIAGSYREAGEMVGPLAMGFIGQTMGLDWAFILVGLAGFASLICIAFLREQQPGHSIEFTQIKCYSPVKHLSKNSAGDKRDG